jgi:hypothetical protein
VGVKASIPTAIFPNKSEAVKESFLSREVIVTFSELSAFVVFFSVTMILYVRTTMITLNQPWIFMKFTTDRNFQSSPINDTVGAVNMGTLHYN